MTAQRHLERLPKATAAFALVAALGGTTLAHGDTARPGAKAGPAAVGFSPGTEPTEQRDRAKEAKTPGTPVAVKAAEPLNATETARLDHLRARLAELDQREAELAAKELSVETQAAMLDAQLARLEALRTAWRVAQSEFEGHVEVACAGRVALERTRGLERAKAAEIGCIADRDEADARSQESRKAAAETERFHAVEQSAAEREEKAEKARASHETAARDAATSGAQVARTAKDEAEKAEKARADAEKQREAADKARAERVEQLSRILKKMKPTEAARLVAEQPDAVALAVLGRLGDRLSAKILAQMPAARATALTQSLLKGNAPEAKP